MNKFAKIIATITIATLIGSAVNLPNNHLQNSALAQAPGLSVPTFETNIVLVGGVKGNFLQRLLEWSQTFVLESLKKRLLDMLVDQIVQWIQGGGKPRFVSDWGGFLRDAANAAAGDAAILAGLGGLCQPFDFLVRVNLLPTVRFTEEIRCTLDQIVGNIENFYNNFRNGSWIALGASWEIQNNYYGALLLAQDKILSESAKAEGQSGLEALAGKGFLSIKSCDEDPKDTKGKDIDGDKKPGDILQTCTITTPGETIGNLVTDALGVDFNYIVNAQQLGQYVSAIANAVTNRLIGEGVKGLQGLTTKKAPRGGFIPPGAGDCVGLAGDVLIACEKYVSSSNNSFDGAQTNLLGQIDKSLSPRKNANGTIDDTTNALKSYQTDLLKIADELNKKTLTLCPARDIYVKNIKDELVWINGAIVDAANNKIQNQAILDRLAKAQTDFNNLKKDDWLGLSTLANQLEKSDILDSVAANTFKADMEEVGKNVKSRISTNIQTFRQNLASCP